MKGNRKVVVYGSVAVVLLVCICVYLFFRLLKDDNKNNSGAETAVPEFVMQNREMLRAIPTDAVFVAIADKTESITDNLGDSVKIIDFVWNTSLLKGQPAIVSLHYSSKNEVSLLFVSNLSAVENGVNKMLEVIKNSGGGKFKDYNGVTIYELNSPSKSYSAIYKTLFINSSSYYVVEAAIRHLNKNLSILDNADFSNLLQRYGKRGYLYFNHQLTGKLFSGCVEYGWLKYSDFFMRLSKWSVFDFSRNSMGVKINANMLCGTDEGNYATVYMGQKNGDSKIAEILPAQTLFFCTVLLPNKKDLEKRLGKFLEVKKKSRSYAERLERVSKGNISPNKFKDSLKIEEVAAAWCKFGDSYQWINLVRTEKDGWFKGVIGRLFKGEQIPAAEEYPYKGYLEAIYGELFSHTDEEFFTKVGDWLVIGPKSIVESYAFGDANYYSFDNYISQTPAKEFAGSKAVSKVFVNMSEEKDSVLMLLQPQMRNKIVSQIDSNDFCAITMDISPNKQLSLSANIDLYITRLERKPVPRERELAAGAVVTDSTIAVPSGPFKLIDFVNGGECFLEQQTNYKLSYINGLKKRAWTIGFDSPLAGMVGQADIFKNGKLQMFFISGDKLYGLDRLGRFVNGYPKRLDKGVVLGPQLFDLEGNREYSFMAIADDNTIIHRYLKSGKPVLNWKDIHSEHFVKTLPVNMLINGKIYWIVRNAYTVEFYTEDGVLVEQKDKRRRIAPDSQIELISGSEVRVTGTNEKEFAFNVETGKTKRL